MCWNFEVSILSFCIGVFISCLYYKRSLPFDKSMCFLILSYSFVREIKKKIINFLFYRFEALRIKSLDFILDGSIM